MASKQRLAWLKAIALKEGVTWQELYGTYKDKFKPYTDECTAGAKTEDGNRWVENISQCLRAVGYADTISRSINHKGWFADNHADETFRGVVYRLPAKNGKERFLAGFEESMSGSNGVLLSFDIHDDEIEAARVANRLAEIDAEKSREYYAKDQAEQRIADIESERIANRQELLAILTERKKAQGQGEYPSLCGAIRSSIKALLRDRESLFAEKQKLIDNPLFYMEY